MAATASAVRVGVTGMVLYAPQSTSVPTATSGGVPANFLEVGYASEDGITLATDTQTQDIRGWQNGDLLRRTQQSVTFSLAFTMMETNEHSLKLYFNNYTHGAGVTDGSVTMNGNQAYRGAFVIDVIDGTNLIRVVFPDGQVSDRGEINIVNADAITYPVTISGYPDASGNSGYLYVSSASAS